MNPTTAPIQAASLYFREGPSDKEYHAAIEPKADGFIVTFAFGRRGSTLNTGTKTPDPLSLTDATKVFDKLVASKLAKGYRATGQSAVPYRQTGLEGRDTGIRCQLLNAIDRGELERLLHDSHYCMQEKHDGRRLLVRKQGNEIIGINRRGLVVAIPEPIREAVAKLQVDVLIDGEAVGETLHAFDLLEVKGIDMRQRRYLDRLAGLIMAISPNQPALRWVSTAVEPNDKLETFEELRQSNREGVVFKNVDAPYSPGRPASGGPQLKYKFVESASFVVTARNARRSVALGLYESNGHVDDDKLVPAGNVTIPPNHAVPAVGEVVEVKYLNAARESGSVYQPVYIGKRCDIPASECSTDQLKYKDSDEVAA
ncbi:MAG: WGR domain-containing protein [Verrucomicrobiota bacterium]